MTAQERIKDMAEQEWPTDWEIVRDDMWDGIPLLRNQTPDEETSEEAEQEEAEESEE
jgi:hypothetical protein